MLRLLFYSFSSGAALRQRVVDEALAPIELLTPADLGLKASEAMRYWLL